jgi:hypothetical protein
MEDRVRHLETKVNSLIKLQKQDSDEAIGMIGDVDSRLTDLEQEVEKLKGDVCAQVSAKANFSPSSSGE